MTAIEILNYVKSAGILLAARGDRLHVEAPAGAVTPALRPERTTGSPSGGRRKGSAAVARRHAPG